jgi:peptide deformylase
MTLRKIALLGQPVLLHEAAPVIDPTAPDVASLIRDMRETLADARGLGLAAPQVYARQRIILAHEPTADGIVDRTAEPLVLINPALFPLGDEQSMAFEGCLSIPGLRGLVPRYLRLGLTALDADGHRIEREAEGLFARILQHEVDHLNGTLYTHRLVDPRHLAFDSEVAALTNFLAKPNAVAGERIADE